MSLTPEKRTFMLGEPIYLTFRVHNGSSHTLQLPEGGDYRNGLGRPNRYRVVIKPRGGKPLPLINSGPSFGGISSHRRLPPDGEFTRELFLPNWAKITKPGVYEISCTRPLELSRYKAGVRPNWRLKGKPVTARTVVTVTPPDSGRMGKLIQELGEMLLNNNSDHARKAGRALLTIADTRTIKHWIKALRTRGYGIKLSAIRGLGTYKTDAALAGLSLCRKDKNTNVRQTCAQVLSSSPHPKAWPVLLSMKADPYTGVRLTVLHALAKRPCAQTAKLIRKMTRDSAKLVKNEAQRYLKRCGRP